MKGNSIGIFAVLAALISHNAAAAAQLPSVSYERGSVSAKELFGAQKTILAKPAPAFAKASAGKPASTPKYSGANEVLVPRRPNSELWANTGKKPETYSEQKIRMPRAGEIVRLDAEEFSLPEEYIDKSKIAYAPEPVRQAPKQSNAERKAQIDNSIARMIEQKNRQQKASRAKSAVEKFSNNINNAGIPRSSRGMSDDKQFAVAAPEPVPAFANAPADRPARIIARNTTDEFAPKDTGEVPMNRLSPRELKQAFYKSYISENKHLSAYSNEDFDSLSSDNWEIVTQEGFVGDNSINANASMPKTLEIRMSFADNDSALTKDNFNLLSEYASMIANNPKRAIQISVSEDAVSNTEAKRLAARRLAIINQVLIDSGVHESRIIPVLVDRADGSFVLRVISTDQFKVLRQTERDMFGDRKSQSTTRSLSW
ncbi:MAG: hypothetical protein LBG89_01105 [Rickettsiales bacterium]|jgi:hypothetical protein|nr:hypothetical protein [Rickettsiales bacterium]